MRKHLVMLCMFAVLAVNGCVFDGESKDAEEQFRVQDYLPSQLSGTVYSWYSETLSLIELETDTTSYTETVSGPLTVDGKQVYTITTSDETLVKRFYVDNNSIYVRIDDTSLDWFSEGYLSGTFEPGYYKLFDFSTSNGDSYDIFETGATIENYYVNFLAKGRRAGNETVTTPAGTFTDAPDFQIDYTVTITPIVTGDTMRYMWTEEYWFGKNTGPVKRRIRTHINYVPTEMITEELTTVSRALD